MTVGELIKYLKHHRKDLPVVYKTHSEHCILEPKDIEIKELCLPREDNWVHDYRPDKETQTYLVLPGN